VPHAATVTAAPSVSINRRFMFGLLWTMWLHPDNQESQLSE
jgi:hypothetical protein